VQNDLYYSLIGAWVDMWRRKRTMRQWWAIAKESGHRKRRQRKQMEYCDEFKIQGYKRMVIKSFKLYSQFAGSRLYEKRAREKVELEVASMVEEKKNQLVFLEQMIREMEEKYRIELRKKAILKSQCDQAYLRGVSAISMEALKMSHSTLADYYRGMKMPRYDGKNIFTQIRNLNGASTGF
jgi:hypothetical protein